jgi:hypothetical protein
MLATVIIALLAGFHTHIHSASLLLVPALALMANSDCPRAQRLVVSAALYTPNLLFFLTGRTRFVAWLMVGLMLWALATVLSEEPGAPSVDRWSGTGGQAQ